MSWYFKKPVQNSELLTGNGYCDEKNIRCKCPSQIPPVAMSYVKNRMCFET
jgi:hypothetical protein